MTTLPSRPWHDLAARRARLVEFAPSPNWHADAVALYDFWREQAARCVKSKVPPRSAFDPLEWRRLLPNLWILEVATPFRLRFRLVGTRVAEQIRNDPTGRWLDEAMPHLSRDAAFMERYQRVVREGEPLWTVGPADIRPDNPVHAVENLTLPFTTGRGAASGAAEGGVTDAGAVDVLLMVSVFHAG